MNRCENAAYLESEAHCHKGLFEKRQLLTILFEALHVVHLARDPPFLSIGMLSWPSSFCACPVLGILEGTTHESSPGRCGGSAPVED